MLAALQPADIKEAVEAVQGSPIARTKLRMIFALARVMFGLSPVDVGAEPVPIVASDRGQDREIISFRVWAQFARTSVLNSLKGSRWGPRGGRGVKGRKGRRGRKGGLREGVPRGGLEVELSEAPPSLSPSLPLKHPFAKGFGPHSEL